MRRYRDESGFTLIEIMVVMVVVGLLAVVAVVNLGSGGERQELQNQVRELYLLMQTASEEAVFNNEELGLRIDETGYQFLILEPETGDWEPRQARLFRPRQWPEKLNATLRTDAELPGLAEGDNGDSQNLTPDLVFFSSGEVTPFELIFQNRDSESAFSRLQTDGLSPIAWIRPGDEEWSE